MLPEIPVSGCGGWWLPTSNQFFLDYNYMCDKIFREDQFSSFYVKLLTDRQRDRQTKNKQTDAEHYGISLAEVTRPLETLLFWIWTDRALSLCECGAWIELPGAVWQLETDASRLCLRSGLLVYLVLSCVVHVEQRSHNPLGSTSPAPSLPSHPQLQGSIGSWCPVSPGYKTASHRASQSMHPSFSDGSVFAVWYRFRYQ